VTTTFLQPSINNRLLSWLRESSLPYVGSLVILAMLAGWSNYLSPLLVPEGLAIKGQALAIVIPIVGFPIPLVLWLLYRGTRTVSRWLLAFLVGLAVSWVLHMVLLRIHGDQNNHLVWLFIPILFMLLWKTPTSQQAWQAILVFAWCAVVILVVTRALEVAGVLRFFHIEQWIIDYEKERYWLPLSGYLGLEGRWPGPFGFNSKTGFISTLLVLIGLARWRRISSPVFILVGVLGILLTGGRGAALALAAGLFILLVFAARGPISRIPMAIRTGIGALAVIGFGLMFFRSPLSTSGRFGDGGIWEGFINIWRTSPWIGVGQTGILADPKAGISMEAHSLYLQELTRSGLLGFAVQFAVIGLGLGIVAVAAYRGLPWPLALLTSYYIASLTEVFQDGWLQQSTYSLFILVCVLAAAGWLADHEDSSSSHINKPGVAA
jgi:hypothetical protein